MISEATNANPNYPEKNAEIEVCSRFGGISQSAAVLSNHQSILNRPLARTNQPKPIAVNTYQMLQDNIYTATIKKEKMYPCQCPDTYPKCYDDTCLNRLTLVECRKNCGQSCKNRRIQNREWALGIHSVLTENKGLSRRLKFQEICFIVPNIRVNFIYYHSGSKFNRFLNSLQVMVFLQPCQLQKAI